jgi:hypothetical protein
MAASKSDSAAGDFRKNEAEVKVRGKKENRAARCLMPPHKCWYGDAGVCSGKVKLAPLATATVSE